MGQLREHHFRDVAVQWPVLCRVLLESLDTQAALRQARHDRAKCPLSFIRPEWLAACRLVQSRRREVPVRARLAPKVVAPVGPQAEMAGLWPPHPIERVSFEDVQPPA